MAYKLMAVDVDGTLLDSNSNLTEGTIQGVEHFNQILNLDLPFITYNGAMVVMGNSRKVLYEQKLSAQNAKEILELGRKYNTTVMIWADNKLFVTEINDRTNKYKEISKVEPILVKDVDKLIKDGATKILWYDEIEKIDKYQSEVGKYLDNRVNYHTSRPMFLEFVDINASKAIAMEKLGEYYGIKQSEMIAVGDGFNDLSMIEYAGLGVVTVSYT